MDFDTLKADERFQAGAFALAVFAVLIAWSIAVDGLME